MLTTKTFTSGTEDAARVERLYETAFPRVERMPFSLLERRAELDDVEFTVYEDDGAFCGFSYILHRESLTLVLYLAVDGAVRSKGHGARILADIERRADGRTLFLDIEALDPNAANIEQRIRRKAFYERNGYASTGYEFDEDGVTYEVLAKGDAFTAQGCVACYDALVLDGSEGEASVTLREASPSA